MTSASALRSRRTRARHRDLAHQPRTDEGDHGKQEENRRQRPGDEYAWITLGDRQ